eukprot:Awhi_evm1s12190
MMGDPASKKSQLLIHGSKKENAHLRDSEEMVVNVDAVNGKNSTCQQDLVTPRTNFFSKTWDNRKSMSVLNKEIVRPSLEDFSRKHNQSRKVKVTKETRNKAKTDFAPDTSKEAIKTKAKNPDSAPLRFRDVTPHAPSLGSTETDSEKKTKEIREELLSNNRNHKAELEVELKDMAVQYPMVKREHSKQLDNSLVSLEKEIASSGDGNCFAYGENEKVGASVPATKVHKKKLKKSVLSRSPARLSKECENRSFSDNSKTDSGKVLNRAFENKKRNEGGPGSIDSISEMHLVSETPGTKLGSDSGLAQVGILNLQYVDSLEQENATQAKRTAGVCGGHVKRVKGAETDEESDINETATITSVKTSPTIESYTKRSALYDEEFASFFSNKKIKSLEK